MKTTSIRSLLSFVLLCGLFLLNGCTENAPTQESVENPTAIPTEEIQVTDVIPSTEAAGTLEPTAAAYPSNPEDVVRQFLIVYPAYPENAIVYLSPEYVQQLDENSALALLPEQGAISGFVVSAGTTSAESEKSEASVNIAYADRAYEVTFNLVIVDGLWMIEGISFPAD